ncbi:MAG: hypothetical protein A2283_06695 [Lentisphaerae bacterium RIFOXYA12_FULL_48_11]|nr:MAG: hypothetical protein A2283_06695 [Lentisphaerae bacterium RIFOXYA12_FULL_48_11]
MNEKILLHTLLDNIPDHIYFKDLESKFVLINKAQARTLKVAHPNDAIGKTDFDFFSDEHAKQAYEDEQKIIRTGEPMVAVEEKETWPDGSITWASSTKVPLYDSQGNIIGTFGISRDITEVKKARGAMEEAERNRVMLESIGAVCHHMGQPATVILTTSNVLEKSLQNADKSLYEMAKDISEAAQVLGEKLHKLNEVNCYKTEEYVNDIRIVEV